MNLIANSKEAAPPGFPLNAEQRAAVEHGEGPLLVIAGAGTERLASSANAFASCSRRTASLRGENILGLTFTDKAAGQMKSRVVASRRGTGRRHLAQHLSFVLPGKNPAGFEAGNSSPSKTSTIGFCCGGISPNSAWYIFRRLAEPARVSERLRGVFFRAARMSWSRRTITSNMWTALRRAHEERKGAMEPDARQVARGRIGEAGRVGAGLSRERTTAARTQPTTPLERN